MTSSRSLGRRSRTAESNFCSGLGCAGPARCSHCARTKPASPLRHRHHCGRVLFRSPDQLPHARWRLRSRPPRSLSRRGRNLEHHRAMPDATSPLGQARMARTPCIQRAKCPVHQLSHAGVPGLDPHPDPHRSHATDRHGCSRCPHDQRLVYLPRPAPPPTDRRRRQCLTGHDAQALDVPRPAGALSIARGRSAVPGAPEPHRSEASRIKEVDPGYACGDVEPRRSFHTWPSNSFAVRSCWCQRTQPRMTAACRSLNDPLRTRQRKSPNRQL